MGAVEVLDASDQLRVIVRLEQQTGRLEYITLRIQRMKENLRPSNWGCGILSAPSTRQREDRAIARLARGVIGKSQFRAKRIGKIGVSDDAFRHASFAEAGDHQFIRIKERQLQPSVRHNHLALVRFQRIRGLIQQPREQFLVVRIRQDLVNALRSRGEFAGGLVPLVESAAPEDRLEHSADAFLTELHLDELEHAAKLLFRLRSDIVDLVRQKFLLTVVEIDQHGGHLLVRELALLAQPAPHVATADEGRKHLIGLRPHQFGNLLHEVSERRSGQLSPRRIVDLHSLRLERALQLRKHLGVRHAQRRQRLVRLHRGEIFRDPLRLVRSRRTMNDGRSEE